MNNAVSTRESLLADMKTAPFATLKRYLKERAIGKREMEYTDIAVAIAMKRACDESKAVWVEFCNDPFWEDRGCALPPSPKLIYCLMYIYGGHRGSPSDRASLHSRAMNVFVDDPSVALEDIVGKIKAGGGLLKLAEAARRTCQPSAVSMKVASHNKTLQKSAVHVLEDEEDESDEPSIHDDDERKEAAPILPTRKKEKLERVQKSTEDLWNDKYIQLQKLAKALGVMVVRPLDQCVLRKFCSTGVNEEKNLKIKGKKSSPDWIEIWGESIEDVLPT